MDGRSTSSPLGVSDVVSLYAAAFSSYDGDLSLPLGLALVYTKETRLERDMCTPMFIAALFIIARTWKQPKGPCSRASVGPVGLDYKCGLAGSSAKSLTG